jgi:cytochrome c oxidase assembly factor CtaG/putative copper export protein
VPDPETPVTSSPTPETAAPPWPPRESVLAVTAGLLIMTGIALWMALDLGHGVAPPSSIADPGRLTVWALPALRLVSDLCAVLTVGLLLTGTLLLPAPGAELAGLALQATRFASWFAVLWVVSAMAQGVFFVSDILGTPVGGLTSNSLISYLFDTTQGRATLWQAGLALVVAIGARWALRSAEAIWVVLLAIVAVLPPALAGHSAASGSHHLAVASLVVHLVAASLWVGGLAGLTWIAIRGSRRLGAAVRRFSVLALWCVVALTVSGVANAAVRIGWGDLFTSSYGGLVVAKASALLVLGALGWVHRRSTVPRLEAAADRRQGESIRRPFASLAVVELAIMGATMAIAVALSRTPPPVSASDEVSPTSEVLGHALPSAPTPWRLLSGFSADGFGIIIVGLLAALYIRGVWILYRRGDAWPIGRVISFGVGLLILAWSTVGGLGLYSHVMFSAHMVAHMLLSMVVPIFLVLGAPVTLALRTLPSARVPGELGPRQMLLAVLHSRVVRVLSHPIVAAALFVGSLYAVYFTGLFGWLMGSSLGHVVMEVHFLAVGSLFFWVLVGIDPTPRDLAPLWRFGLLLVVMPFHAFFSIAVMSAETVIGVNYWRLLDRPYRTDLLQDQYLGGSISWALGEVPIVLVLLAVFVQWVRSDTREARRIDRAADRAGDDADLAHYNAWLARLDAAEREREGRTDRS